MKKVYIVAGGTGGHINAAISIGDKLSSLYQVRYLSGTRYLDKQLFSKLDVVHLESKPLRTKNPFKLFWNILLNFFVYVRIMSLFLMNRPSFVIGCGGYVCGPTLLAAKMLFIPIFIIEQNAVVGLTNRILSKISNLVFTNFKNTKGLPKTSKVLQVGNPVRAAIQYTENTLSEGELNLLVFGGSLGATQINDIIELLIQRDFPFKLNIIHQVGANNLKEHKSIHANINYEAVEYIDDMAEKYKWSNIILSRAGASSISELRIVGRPCILIPYPLATDNHQFYNALNLRDEKISYVEVLDHSKEIEILADKVYDAIIRIKDENHFQRLKAPENINVAASIQKEIEKYVWHK